MRKKSLLFLLLIFVLSLIVTLTSYAATIVDSGKCGDNVTYTLDSDGLLTISGSGWMDRYRYDSNSQPYAPWYSNRLLIKNVVVNNGISNIGDFAFYSCENLISIEIPDTIRVIGCSSFYSCKNLKNIEFSNILTSIGNYAFYDCENITSIEISATVTSIGYCAFGGCDRLVSIVLPFVGENRNATGNSSVFGYIFGYTAVKSSSTNTLGATFQYYDYNSSTAYYYFIPSSLKTVILTDSVQIPDNAFKNCDKLTSVKIPDKVTSIGQSAFNCCSNLESMVIPATVTSISSFAFAECYNLAMVSFEGNAPTLGTNAFPTSNDIFVVFYNSSFLGFTTPVWNGLLCYPLGYTIDDYSTLDANCKNAQGIFFTLNTASKTATVGDLSTKSNNSRYAGICDGKVVIPDTVTDVNGVSYRVIAISQNAFSYNKLLTSVSIPSTVISIGNDAFRSCYNVKEFIVSNDSYSFSNGDDGSLYNKNKSNLICYPGNNGITAYTLPDGITSITAGAFSGCIRFTEMTIQFVGTSPSSTTSKFSDIFGSMPENLKKVTFVGTAINDSAFSNCTNLESIVISNSVTSIGKQAFYNCSKLTS